MIHQDKQLVKFMENLMLTDYANGSKYGEDWFLRKFERAFGVSFDSMDKKVKKQKEEAKCLRQ